jgi:hypothetical protein
MHTSCQTRNGHPTTFDALYWLSLVRGDSLLIYFGGQNGRMEKRTRLCTLNINFVRSHGGRDGRVAIAILVRYLDESISS